MERRFVDWHINGRGRDYEVIRFENGNVVQVAICDTREQAWEAAHLDRARVLADPLAHEAKPVEQHIRTRR